MGLQEALASTKIQDTNVRPAVTVPETATVRDAVGAMRDAGLGCAIVVNEQQQATGMLTEGILRHCLSDSDEVLSRSVTDEMVSRLPWVSPGEPISVVQEAMEENNIRFLGVLDDDRKVLGVTGQKTLMEFLAEFFPHEVLTQDPTAVTVSRQKEGA